MTASASFASRRGYFAVSLAVFAADQAAKLAADAWLRGRGSVAVIPGFFNLWYSRNRGGLFGSFSDLGQPWRALLLTVLPVLAVAGIAWFLSRTAESRRPTLTGLALVLGGAAGNVLDRAIRGEVVDFLDAYVSHRGLAAWLSDRFGTAHWPTFNVADSAIVVGACLLLLDVVRPEPKRPEAVAAPGPSTE